MSTWSTRSTRSTLSGDPPPPKHPALPQIGPLHADLFQHIFDAGLESIARWYAHSAESDTPPSARDLSQMTLTFQRLISIVNVVDDVPLRMACTPRPSVFPRAEYSTSRASAHARPDQPSAADPWASLRDDDDDDYDNRYDPFGMGDAIDRGNYDPYAKSDALAAANAALNNASDSSANAASNPPTTTDAPIVTPTPDPSLSLSPSASLSPSLSTPSSPSSPSAPSSTITSAPIPPISAAPPPHRKRKPRQGRKVHGGAKAITHVQPSHSGPLNTTRHKPPRAAHSVPRSPPSA